MKADGGAWPFRVVGDTNVYVSSVHPAKAARAVAAGYLAPPGEDFILRALEYQFVLLISFSGYLELAEKLQDLGVNEALAQKLLDLIRDLAEEVQVSTTEPYCVDPDDDRFVWAARDGGASHLVTEDRALNRLQRNLPFRIVRLVGFLRELREQLKHHGTART